MFLRVKHILIITPIINSIKDGNMAMVNSNNINTMEHKAIMEQAISILRITIILKVISIQLATLKATKHLYQIRMEHL